MNREKEEEEDEETRLKSWTNLTQITLLQQRAET